MNEVTKPILARLSSGPLTTEYGDFMISVFTDGLDTAVVLQKGQVDGQSGVLCRVHSHCISSHVFLSTGCDCSQQMRMAQELIAETGRGLIVWLDQEGKGNGPAAQVATLSLKKNHSQAEAYRLAGFRHDVRRYDIVAKILKWMQVSSIVLISGNKEKTKALKSAGIPIESRVDLKDRVTLVGQYLDNVIDYIQAGVQDPVLDREKYPSVVFVVGDLTVDFEITSDNVHREVIDQPIATPGGTGFNAALAFKDTDLIPVLFGSIGDDHDGRLMLGCLGQEKITSLVSINRSAKTGTCHLFWLEDGCQRVLVNNEPNANDFSLEDLGRSLELVAVGDHDLIFLAIHILFRRGPEKTREAIELLRHGGARIILDLVPHDLESRVSLEDYQLAIGEGVDLVIAEYRTLQGLLGLAELKEAPTDDEWISLFDAFRTNVLDVRFGDGNIERQVVCTRHGKVGFQVILDEATGYIDLSPADRRGFGDRRSAGVVAKLFGDGP